MSYDLSLEFFVHAAPDEVMALLTDPDFVNEWSGTRSTIEKKVGGKYSMFDGWAEGEILKMTDDELVYTWKPRDWDKNTPASEVQYKLVPAEHGTEVFVKHTNLPNEEEMENHRSGWEEFVFGPIGEYLANRNL